MREYLPNYFVIVSLTHTDFSPSLSLSLYHLGLKYLFLSISGFTTASPAPHLELVWLLPPATSSFVPASSTRCASPAVTHRCCNGPRQKRRPQPSAAITLTTPLLPVFSVHILLLSLTLCWQTFTWGRNKQSSAADNTEDMNQNCLSWDVPFEMYILWGMLKLCTVFVFFLPLLFVAACLQSSNTTQHWEFLSSRSRLTSGIG